MRWGSRDNPPRLALPRMTPWTIRWEGIWLQERTGRQFHRSPKPRHQGGSNAIQESQTPGRSEDGERRATVGRSGQQEEYGFDERPATRRIHVIRHDSTMRQETEVNEDCHDNSERWATCRNDAAR